MEVSIIIVNYNTFEVTCNCLTSVFEKTSGVSFELIVVDNASTDINPERFRDLFPLIRLVKSKDNLGFAGGNNLGIKQSKGDVLLLLNSDTILINNAVKLAFDKIKSDKSIGCLTCSVLNLDETPQGILGRFPSIKQNLLSIFRIEKFVKKYREDRYKLGDQFDYKTMQEGDWIWGTFFMFSRLVLNQFPEQKLHDNFFMYGEDLQWCMYIKKKLGLSVLFIPEPKIFHIHGASDTRKYIEKYKQWSFPNFIKTLRLLKSDTYAYFYLLTLLLQRVLVRGNLNVELSYYAKQLRFFLNRPKQLMHKISVIIPNFNRASVIGETIDAILGQTLRPYEIIVIDDGSTDDSLEVLQKYGDAIKVFTQENQGPGAARNKGIKEARGEFIQLMDSDDIPSLNKLEVQLAGLLNQNADVVIGPWVRGWFNNRNFKPENVVLQSEGLPADNTILDWFLTDWSMVFQQALIRKDVLLRVGLYDEQMQVMEDGDLFVKLLLADAKIVFEGQSLTLYRLGHADKLTNSGASDMRKLKDHLYFYRKLFGYSNSLKVYGEARFQLRLFILNKALKRHGIEDVTLNRFINKSVFSFKMLAIKQRLSKGLQQRLKGHRWSKAYQTSRLGKKHIAMIQELGYKLLP